MFVNPAYARISRMQETVDCMLFELSEKNIKSDKKEVLFNSLLDEKNKLVELIKNEPMMLTQDQYDCYMESMDMGETFDDETEDEYLEGEDEEDEEDDWRRLE